MKTCQCREENPDDAVYCASCGRRLIMTDVPEESNALAPSEAISDTSSSEHERIEAHVAPVIETEKERSSLKPRGAMRSQLSRRRWTATAIVSALVFVAVTAFAIIGSNHNSPQSAVSTVPGVVICSGDPTFQPTSLYWCASSCSSYAINLSWTSWNQNSATGIGTLMTNDGVPNCSQGTWTAHPNYTVSFSDPKRITYCDGNALVTRLLFAKTTFEAEPSSPEMPIPMFRGPTC